MLAAFQQPLILYKPSGCLLLAREDCLAGSIEGLIITIRMPLETPVSI